MVLGALTATNTSAVRPEAVSDGSTARSLLRSTPVGLSKQAVNVVVQLSGDPVAVQQETAGRKLSKAEKDAAKNALKNPQNALKSRSRRSAARSSRRTSRRITASRFESRATRRRARGAARRGRRASAATDAARNTNGIPLIGAPSVWQNLGLHGENIKIAVIDTGIDYTHANFGGPGTVAAYNAAHRARIPRRRIRRCSAPRPRASRAASISSATATTPIRTPPTYQPIPHPDPNPLDCPYERPVGHGSHVAGTAAGSGVLANGATYTGPYNATTVSGNSWTVGPGVAPKADIYSVRVFGCDGSTDVTVDAIEWAVDNDMDVINMSLGSSFGTNDDPSAVATTNAAKAGVVVVTSAGNSGASPYIIGSPGTADGAIATAANDPLQLVPGIRINTTPPTGTPLSLQAINANGVDHRTAAHGAARRAEGQPGHDDRHSRIPRLGRRVARLLAPARTRSTASFPAAAKSPSRSAAPARAWRRQSSPSRPARPSR